MRVSASALGLLLILVTAPSAPAQTYEAVEDWSSYTTGCLPPCLCPLIFVGTVSGTFEVDYVSTMGDVDEYAVEVVDLVATNLIGLPTPITGSGTYAVNLVDNTHEMNLDLLVEGELDTYFSGVVPITSDWPFPDISINVGTATTCFGKFLAVAAIPVDPPIQDFSRGDCNGDGTYDMSDAIAALTSLFVAGPAPCELACDANDDDVFDVADPVYVLGNLFAFGPDPAEPFPGCGNDPTAGGLGCDAYSVCP